MAQADSERGDRIKWLREDKLHLTQEAMADKVGITLRGYQEWEAGGGIKWPNAQKLAKVAGVTADWIMSGDVLHETPDLSKGQAETQMDRIEANQQRILAELAAIRLGLAGPSRRQKPRRQSRPGKEATGS